MRVKLSFIILFLLSMLILSSCITPKKVNYLQKTSSHTKPIKNNVGYEEYKLQPNDKIFLRIYSPDEKINTLFNGGGNNINQLMSGNTDYSDLYSYTIKENGTIKLPLVGDIVIGGYPLREAKQKLEMVINSTMVDKCAVDLRIVGQYFSIIGSTTNGLYPITREKMNIFQALAMAGDISIYGDRARIKLLRETDDGVSIKTFDIRRKDIINSEFYYIQPNDVIYIQDVKSQFFSVTSFGSALSTLFSTFSFGMLIYNLATPDVSTSNSNQNPL